MTFPGVEEFKTEDEISNDINTLVTVEEQWTKLEQTVWKRPTPASPLIRADSVEILPTPASQRSWS